MGQGKKKWLSHYTRQPALIQSFDETEVESNLAILQLKYNTVNIKNREFIRTQTRTEKPFRRSGIGVATSPLCSGTSPPYAIT